MSYPYTSIRVESKIKNISDDVLSNAQVAKVILDESKVENNFGEAWMFYLVTRYVDKNTQEEKVKYGYITYQLVRNIDEGPVLRAVNKSQVKKWGEVVAIEAEVINSCDDFISNEQMKNK